jgi:hypothetical protein
MARARNIKPAILINEDLAALPMSTRWLFVGLWMLADREGRLEDRPRRIKAEVFPYDDVDVDEALASLASSAFIQRYTAFGQAYIQVTNFKKHQRPHSNEAASEIPPPPTDGVGASEKAPESPQNIETANQGEQHGTPRLAALRPDTGYLIPDSLIPDTGLSERASALDAADAAPPTQPPPEPESISTSPKKAERGQRIPSDFVPSAALRQWAADELGLDAAAIERETAKFCDHFRGSGKTKIDWPATWRNWMRNAAEGTFGRGRASPGLTGTPPITVDAVQAEVERRRREREQRAGMNPAIAGGPAR